MSVNVKTGTRITTKRAIDALRGTKVGETASGEPVYEPLQGSADEVREEVARRLQAINAAKDADRRDFSATLEIDPVTGEKRFRGVTTETREKRMVCGSCKNETGILIPRADGVGQCPRCSKGSENYQSYPSVTCSHCNGLGVVPGEVAGEVAIDLASDEEPVEATVA